MSLPSLICTAIPADPPPAPDPTKPPGPTRKRRGNPNLALAPRCGARTRSGCPCRAPAIRGKLCCRACMAWPQHRPTHPGWRWRPHRRRAHHPRPLRLRVAGPRPPHPEPRAPRPGVSGRDGLPRPTAAGPAARFHQRPWELEMPAYTPGGITAAQDRAMREAEGRSPCTVEARRRRHQERQPPDHGCAYRSAPGCAAGSDRSPCTCAGRRRRPVAGCAADRNRDDGRSPGTRTGPTGSPARGERSSARTSRSPCTRRATAVSGLRTRNPRAGRHDRRRGGTPCTRTRPAGGASDRRPNPLHDGKSTRAGGPGGRAGEPRRWAEHGKTPCTRARGRRPYRVARHSGRNARQCCGKTSCTRTGVVPTEGSLGRTAQACPSKRAGTDKTPCTSEGRRSAAEPRCRRPHRRL